MKHSRRATALFCWLAIFFFANIAILFAQEEGKMYSTNKATMIGVGSSNLYDTYLSPLQYRGLSLHLLNERMKKTNWFRGGFSTQQFIELELASADNTAGNASEYFFLLGYSWGGHYDILKTNKFRLALGGAWHINAGALYNQRNTNNPVSAKAYTNLHLSAIAFYTWKSMTFRGQLDTPLLGVLFSPEYGQSYYEISLGNSIKTINFASLHNQRALRAYFTVDIPISRVSLRIGYLGSFYQTKVNYLQAHNYSSSFIIGLVSESINLSGNKIKNNPILDSSYY
jgi:hypothetical protein